MKKLFTIILILVATNSQSQDTINIQKIVDQALQMQADINDIYWRMEDYATLNNVAFGVTLFGAGIMILAATVDEAKNDDALFYTGAGITAIGTCMLYLNSNKLKRKMSPSHTPAYVIRRMKKQYK